MAVLVGKKKIGPEFSNAQEIVKVIYDFAADTGAVADYDVLEAAGPVLVKLAGVFVETAVTSGGSLVVDLGKGAGGTDFWSDKAVAALTVNSVHGVDSAADKAVYLASGEKIVLGLEVAAATAGKVHFIFEVMKAK